MKKQKNLKTTFLENKLEEAELNKLIRKQQRQDIRSNNMTIIEETLEQGKGFKQTQPNKHRFKQTQSASSLNLDNKLM